LRDWCRTFSRNRAAVDAHLRSDRWRGNLAALASRGSFVFFSRRCFVVVLMLAVGAALAPVQSAHPADNKDSAADKIVISGASGGLAGETIDALLGRGVSPDKLILVTRTPEKLSALQERGAEVRAGDFNKPDSLPAAFAGGRVLFLISTNGGGDRVAQHSAAISAARRAGIKHIVYTSWINAVEGNPAVVTKDHRATEDVLRKSGVPYTILRNQRYSDGLVGEAALAISAGVLISNSGIGKWAPVARRDCAEAAAMVLTGSGHEGRTYDITGPDLISERDFASIVSGISGKPVRVADVDDAAYISMLQKAGVPEAGATAAASFGLATRTNYMNIKSETLQLLLGRKPQSVRELLVEHRSELKAGRP
jgi:NAD(P)H dehydrogenase (quinone)